MPSSLIWASDGRPGPYTKLGVATDITRQLTQCAQANLCPTGHATQNTNKSLTRWNYVRLDTWFITMSAMRLDDLPTLQQDEKVNR